MKLAISTSERYDRILFLLNSWAKIFLTLFAMFALLAGVIGFYLIGGMFSKFYFPNYNPAAGSWILATFYGVVVLVTFFVLFRNKIPTWITNFDEKRIASNQRMSNKIHNTLSNRLH